MCVSVCPGLQVCVGVNQHPGWRQYSVWVHLMTVNCHHTVTLILYLWMYVRACQLSQRYVPLFPHSALWLSYLQGIFTRVFSLLYYLTQNILDPHGSNCFNQITNQPPLVCMQTTTHTPRLLAHKSSIKLQPDSARHASVATKLTCSRTIDLYSVSHDGYLVRHVKGYLMSTLFWLIKWIMRTHSANRCFLFCRYACICF